MLQEIQGKPVYVVDLKTMPELPVVGTGFEQHYAEALTQAIHRGIIKEPGKYGIYIDFATDEWEVYKIIDPVS